MNKIEEIKIDWEKEYTKLVERCNMLEKELQQEQEKNKNRICNDTNYEIIKRLDVIGDMLGDIARDNELRFKKEKMENAKREYEMWYQEYNGYRNDYRNVYRERI